jgi:hypothetical protein
MPAEARLKPVDQFYRARFADESTLRAWARRVSDFAATPPAMRVVARDPRPVIFIPLVSEREGPVSAYMSAGARILTSRLTSDVALDPSALRIEELPEGLTLLMGYGVDADTYEQSVLRRRGR